MSKYNSALVPPLQFLQPIRNSQICLQQQRLKLISFTSTVNINTQHPPKLPEVRNENLGIIRNQELEQASLPAVVLFEPLSLEACNKVSYPEAVASLPSCVKL